MLGPYWEISIPFEHKQLKSYEVYTIGANKYSGNNDLNGIISVELYDDKVYSWGDDPGTKVHGYLITLVDKPVVIITSTAELYEIGAYYTHLIGKIGQEYIGNLLGVISTIMRKNYSASDLELKYPKVFKVQ